MRTLIKDATILTMSDKGVIGSGYLVIEGSKIVAVEAGDAPNQNFDQVIDGEGFLLIPGLINTHTHAAMILLRGYADDMPLMEWLHEKIFPFEEKLTAEHIYWGTKLAIIEMVKSGTTCFADMYFFMDRVAEAVLESGMRAVLARGLSSFSPPDALDECRALYRDYQQAGDGRIKIWVSPHAPYTCTPEFLQKCIALAKELNTGIHIHVSETLAEQHEIKDKYGKTPTAHLESLGLFEVPVLAAHGVHLNAEDIQVFRKYNASVAHNPESNMKLASGVAPVTSMLEAGVNVSLGTDGASSNNDLSLLLEMRMAAFLQKLHNMDATALPAHTALEMATVNGAKALGWEQEIGKLAAGYQADLVMVKATSANMTPLFNPMSNLAYSASNEDVESVMVAGRCLLQNRNILPYSEQETIDEIRRLIRDINKT